MSNNRITEFLDSENSFEPRADTECKEYDAYDSLFSLARSKVSSSPEERLYATTDANHNVTSIDDVFGSVKQRFVYDPYRKSTALTSAWASTSDGYSWVVRSQGEREDVTTNTIDSRNRVYGLGVGRWMQADNIGGYVDGANRYQFVRSSPTAATDSTGQFSSGVHIHMTLTESMNWASATGHHFQHSYDLGLAFNNAWTDFSHGKDNQYHAQGDLANWVQKVGDDLEIIEMNMDYHFVLKAMAELLHGLQDFFSHTDWIEGDSERMKALYITRGYPGWATSAKDGHGAKLIEIDDLYHNNVELSGVQVYDGGESPFDHSSFHYLFAADDHGQGRDQHFDGMFSNKLVGIPGAFDDAYRSAAGETRLLLSWAEQHMQCICHQEIFGERSGVVNLVSSRYNS